MIKTFHSFLRRVKPRPPITQALLNKRALLLPGTLVLAIGAGLPLTSTAQEGTGGEARAADDSAARRPAAKNGEKDRTEDVQQALDRIFDDPLGGVVVNRTVTVLGKDFYRYFSTYWRYSPESARYSISVHERPTARFGSEIWVLYRQQRMFHIFLPPARQATRGISEIAVEHVLENISRRELERITTRNPDLGPEEL